MLYKTRLENGTIEILPSLLSFEWSLERSCSLTKKRKKSDCILFPIQSTTRYALCYSLHNSIDYFVQLNYQLLRELIWDICRKILAKKKNWWNIPYNWGLLIIFCYNFISYSSEKRDLCYDEISSSINILYFWGRCVSHFSRSNLKIRLGNAQKKIL